MGRAHEAQTLKVILFGGSAGIAFASKGDGKKMERLL
jgi:hypothetical protein